MDPIALIMAALAAGAIAGTEGAATDAVKDAYAGLRVLVQRRFTGKPAGETALEKYEAKPEAWQGALEAELVEADAANDLTLVESAQRLMAMVDSAGSRAGRYRVAVHGGQGVQIGEAGTQHNYYGVTPAQPE